MARSKVIVRGDVLISLDLRTGNAPISYCRQSRMR